MKIRYLIAVLFIISACANVNTNLSISRNFNKDNKRIAILPFYNSGKGGYDSFLSDSFSLEMMDASFVVIERSQLEKIFSELQLSMSGMLSNSEINIIGRMLNVDIILFGTVDYKINPGGAFILPSGLGFSQGAAYYPVGISIRFVDVATGEVLIAANRNSGILNHCLKAIANEIKNRLSNSGKN